MATAKTNPLPDSDDFSEEVARARALAVRYRLEFVEMSEFRIDQDLFRSIPADLMLRYGFVPHRREGRSLVIVVSDFQSVPGWERSLGRLALRHEVVAVRIVDPLERQLPDLGLVTIQDAETGEQLFVDTHDRGFRRRFAEAAERREQALHSAFAHAGVDVLELSTDGDLVDALMRYAELRRLRSRLAAGGSR